jgi:hypothetical protein
MKKITPLIVCSGLILILFNSCTTDIDTLSDNNSTTSTHLNKKDQTNLEASVSPERIENQLVIRFRERLKEESPIAYNKMKIDKRNFYGISAFESCSCEDNRIELWSFPIDINVEVKLGVMETEEDLEGDFQFLLSKPNKSAWYTTNTPSSFNASHTAINSTNTGVIIAVIDSGVNYNYSEFEEGFLYNGGLGGSCYNTNDSNYEYSGWNFADNSNNTFDDYGHGTVVTNIITRQLDITNTDYRILPIKVFNAEGKTNYFKIACGFSYAAKNTDVNIIVSSLGWYKEKQGILEHIIQDIEHSKLIVASAGNAGVSSDVNSGGDLDTYDTAVNHFPSGYNGNNIISIAGVDTSISTESTPYNRNLAWFSNFGAHSVDIAAPSQNIAFHFNGVNYFVDGTSFANAYAAGKAALFFINQSIQDLKNQVILPTYTYPSLVNKLKYSSTLH